MVKVEICDGLLEGEKIENTCGGSFYSFKSIPYAKPPTGDLRFKAPQPPEPWNGVRNAKEPSPICSQYESFMFHKYCGQEDCLYLNIYTPNLTPNSLLPVMVWIHGGGFACGSGSHDIYGPEFLVRKDVILVTFNYRLEALGFLCLDTEDIPGNAGMKDQVAVLRWVQKNIKAFGGDPGNVTVFGESAGAACISYLLVSPMSVGLFKRAIIQSGASTNWWSRCQRPRDRALMLARKLGCYSENNAELANFFKSLPVESLIKIKLPISIFENVQTKLNLSFAIVDEKQFDDSERFFFEDGSGNEKLEIHKDIEVIIGYTEHEGVMALNSGVNIEEMLYDANNLGDYFVPLPIAYRATIEEQLEIGKKIKMHYFNNEVICIKNIKQLLKLLSMSLFIHGVITFARVIAQTECNKVFLYKFTCKSKRNVFAEKYGANNVLGEDIFVSHADDLAYLFPLSIMTQEVDQNSEEYQLIDKFTELWTNFAKYGNPTPDETVGPEWLPFTVDKQDYLDIGNILVMDKFPEKDEIIFWDKIYRGFFHHFGLKPY